MSVTAWSKAVRDSADPERAAQFGELLKEHVSCDFTPEQARILAALFSGSNALGTLLVSHPDWLQLLAPETLKHPRSKQGLQAEATAKLEPFLSSKDYSGALNALRQFKNSGILRLGARDLAHLGGVVDITQELSSLADVCLEGVYRVCWQQACERTGRPFHQDHQGHWHATSGCVLGLGKLGGQELNYSSDVDVIFIYAAEGSVFRDQPGAGRPAMTNHQFFNKIAESFIAEVGRLAPEGSLYRIDLRLRPEGDSGPLSRSIDSYENYYAQWGQTWERMMLIKARGVAGDSSLAAEFMEMVQPFRYPRSLQENVLREVAAMKDRIEHEVVKSGELDRNVKLGRGGIREIEFIVQSQQLLHAGRQPFLQGAQTLPCLKKLAQYEHLKAVESEALGEAYQFLREVEHRLQMEENLQTHTIPVNRAAQQRLARLMGFANASAFEAARRKHTAFVRRTFERVLKAEGAEGAANQILPREFAHSESRWRELLEQHRFRDIDKAYRMLREFVEGPGFVHVSARTSELALQLLPRFFALCPDGDAFRKLVPRTNLLGTISRGKGPEDASIEITPGGGLDSPIHHAAAAPLSDPDRVLTRLDSFISVYGARSTLFELWNSNPGIFELLVLLFDRSEFLAELAIRTPDLVDELVTSERLRDSKTAEQTLADLRYGLQDSDQHLWLRRYHQAELMRIGLRDILGLSGFEHYLAELSALADACLQYALEVVTLKHSRKPAARAEHTGGSKKEVPAPPSPPLAVVGLGKLGGAEIDYGSDLDVVFVADRKARNLAALVKIAVEVKDLLSLRTEQGIVFQVDARLRPDGEKGLLVNTLKAYEDYYRNRALLWEIQSLSRSRFVGGNGRIGEEFQEMAKSLTNLHAPTARGSAPGQPAPSQRPACITDDWKRQIHRMRLRIEKERTPSGQADLAIKTGAGGLVDAEFIAQALSLEHGWHEATTLRALERGREAGALPEADHLIRAYRWLRRVEGILRRWSYEGETVLPKDPAPYYRVAIRCGYASADQFREAVADNRRIIRTAYNRVFQT